MSEIWNSSGLKTLAALVIIAGGSYAWREHANDTERKEKAREHRESEQRAVERAQARAKARDAGVDADASGAASAPSASAPPIATAGP